MHAKYCFWLPSTQLLLKKRIVVYTFMLSNANLVRALGRLPTTYS